MRCAVFSLLLLFAAHPARMYAQTTTAEIVGSIHDQSGAVVPGAEVSITNKGTGESRKTVAASDGAFIFNLVQPGVYQISVVNAGFKRFEVQEIRLGAGDESRIDATLAVGATSESVSVEATTPLLQSESSTLQSSVVQQAVQDLPLNGRNFVQLVQLVPGANEGPPNSLTNGTRPDDKRQSASISANGQSEVLNNQMIDGMDNNESLIGSVGVRPSVDAISEIRVQTNVYSADTGRTGGAAINIISKSGTNNFHGTAYEYFRNDVFNSYPFQFGAQNPKQELRQNQFGASIGGPILRNRAFFFTDYEGFRLVQGSNPSISLVPTLFEKQHPGNFSDQPASAGSAYYNVVLPSASLDSAALAYYQLYPSPNLPNTTPTKGPVQGQYVGVSVGTQFSNVFDVRLDYQLNERNSIFTRYSYNNVKTWTPGALPAGTIAGVSVIPNFGGYSPGIAHNFSVSYTHTFSQNLLLQLQAGFLRADNETYPPTYGNGNKVGQAINTALGMPGVNVSANTSGLARVQPNGYAQLGVSGFIPLTDLTTAFQYMATANYTHGQHNVKIGAGVIRRQLFSVQSAQNLPSWSFLDLPSLVQGIYSQVLRNLVLNDPHYRRWEPSAYIQDDWRVSKNTTVNVGLRYDIFTPFTEVHNYISTWDPASQALLVAGVNGVSSTANVRTIYSNFAPRVGFATTLQPGLVVRGGFGLSYYPDQITSNATPKNQPFLETYGPFSSATAAANGYPGFTRLINGAPPIIASSATNPSGSIRAAIDPQSRPIAATQFNLAIQKDLRRNVLTVAYVGVLNKHMPQIFVDLNAPLPNTSANPQTLRPYYAKYPNLTQIGWYTTGAVSAYHGLQTSIERRLAKGLSFAANYTYAREVDNSQEIGAIDPGYGSIISQSHSLDYGNGDLDLRNRAVATTNYTLPFASKTTGFTGLVAKGWQVNLLSAWSAGQPFTVSNLVNLSNTNPGGAGDRPNMVGNPRLSARGIQQFFNTAAFVAQAPGTLGNEARNVLYGPHYRHVDMSLNKSFPLRESASLVFRAEGFNVTNTANFATPGATLGSSTFGKLTATSSAYGPRVVQLALKLTY